MRKLDLLYILAGIYLINRSATRSSNVLNCLLNDSSLLRLLSFLGKNLELHILASSACLEESPGVIKRFLSHASIPPRAFFTRLSEVGGDHLTCDGTSWLRGSYTDELCVRSVILLACGRSPWKSRLRSPPKFITYLLVDAGMESNAGRLRIDGVLREYSEELNFFEAVCSENRLLLSRNQASVRPSQSLPGVSLFPQLEGSNSLGGATLSMHCVYYTTCRQPGLMLFVEMLRSKNATVHIHPDAFFRLSYRQMKTFLTSLVPGSIVYNPAHEMRQIMAFQMLNPHLTVVRFLETVEFKFFVKKPSRFPKSAVLVLPLEWPVWIMLAATYVFVLVLLHAQMSLGTTRYSFRRRGIALGLISSMLQQSAMVTFRGRNVSAPRASFGMWLILALVVSSAFKGRLTSLLKNIPFAETLPRLNVDHGAYIGYSGGAVECIRDSREVPRHPTVRFPAGDNSGTCFVHKVTYKSATKMFIMANSFPQEILYTVMQQLDALGYTWVEGEVGGALAGPAVPYASPYKQALADLLQKVVEAGLFENARDLDHFKAVYERARMLLKSAPPDDGTLILSDLEPYFATLAVGITSSLVVLLAEYLTHHCRCCFSAN